MNRQRKRERERDSQNRRIVMESMMSLDVKCPCCGHSLMEEDHLLDNEPSIGLRFRQEGVAGWVCLSSVYGSFLVESEVPIPEGMVVEMVCPHCGQTLGSTDRCDVCQALLIPLSCQGGGSVAICSRRGCRRHFLDYEDSQEALAKCYDSDSNARSPGHGTKEPTL
jgi:predicted RNA-binding Zn-ribbon protein involved in translation (DUF1610 family)